MNKLRRLSLACFLAFSFAIPANAQDATPLQRGTPIERELVPGQVHKFTVSMEENNVIQFVVEQRGIDVIIKVVAPGGKPVGQYDSPNGTDGPEHVSFMAQVAGSYSITVESLDPARAEKGRYQIKVLELRPASEQETKTVKNRDVVKAKGIALLKDLDEAISQIKSPATRMAAQVQAATLLKEDAKTSSKFLSDAIAGLKEFIAACDANEYEYTSQYPVIVQLRYEILQLLAANDPDAALSFLAATVPPANPFSDAESRAQERNLELIIANQVMAKDPKRSIQIARKTLKEGYSPELLKVVSEVKQKDPQLAADFALEIVAKLLNEKLTRNSEAGQLATAVLNYALIGGRSVLSVEGDGLEKKLLPDDKLKELLQKVLNEVTSYPNPRTHPHSFERDSVWAMLQMLKMMGEELDKTISGASTSVAKKYDEFVGPDTSAMTTTPDLSSRSLEEAREIIQKERPEEREDLYVQLASREAGNGDLSGAKQIVNEQITNPFTRRQWLANFEQQEIHQALARGKVEDALRIIGGVSPAKQRALYLSQVVSQIGAGRTPAATLNLLEQARALLPVSVQAQDQEQMSALLEIARAFSRHDPKRAFEIVDPLIDQFNEISVAARTVQGFGGEFFEDDELNMKNGNSVGNAGGQITSVLGALALTNFDRAKTTSDRIRLPEVRLKAYLDIAQTTIAGVNN